jgi:hypothetical protein
MAFLDYTRQRLFIIQQHILPLNPAQMFVFKEMADYQQVSALSL